MFVRQQAQPTVKIQNHDDLVALKELVEAGKVTPVIDGTYPLSETPKAIGHVAAGHARGTVVIALDQGRWPEGWPHERADADGQIRSAPTEAVDRREA